MKFSIDAGDIIVSPYKYEPNITPYKKYRVISKIDNNTIKIIDDTGTVQNHHVVSFFEADTFFELSLYRIFKILLNFKPQIIS